MTASARKRNKKNVVAIVIAVIVVILFLSAGTYAARAWRCDLRLQTECVGLEVAGTVPLRAKGLSGRDGLEAHKGMLFTFNKDGSNCMWMSDMKFSIDMVWTDAKGKIVTMSNNVSPDTYPQTFCSETPSRYVIELPAGTIQQNNMQVGQKLKF